MPPSRRPGTIGVLVVVLLTISIVGAVFLLTGDGAAPERTSSEASFVPVGERIDGAPGDPVGIELAPEERMELAVPESYGVEATVAVTDGLATLQKDVILGDDPVKGDCFDESVGSDGGFRRLWTAGPRGDVEVDVRILDLRTRTAAETFLVDRQTDEFLACLPGEVSPKFSDTGPLGGEVSDSSLTTTGGELELTALIEAPDSGAAITWRQVDQFVVIVTVIELDAGSRSDVMLGATEELVEMISAALRN